MAEKTTPTEPYKGLVPYSEDDAPFFFGRDVQREVIAANLMASRLTLLYGKTGVGKSSVLRAGVAYHLRRLARRNLAEYGTPEFAVVVFSSWRDDPIVALTDRVRESVAQTLNGQLFEPIPQSHKLAETLRVWTERIGGDLLIILDQFEDYFLYHNDEDGEGTFAVEFPRAVNSSELRVNFLVSIREDALARVDRFKGKIPGLFDNYLRLDHLDPAAARDAIEKPVEKYNTLQTSENDKVTIEPKLVDKVLEDVGIDWGVVGDRARVVANFSSAPAQARIETPYLQLVMTRLWKEEMYAKSLSLRLETLNQLGGVERIVHTHLDGVMEILSGSDQKIAAMVFHHLVTPSGTKIAHTVPDLAEYAEISQEELKPVLVKLSENRILRPVESPAQRPGDPRYEIFHDVLAPAILAWRTRYLEAQRASASIEYISVEYIVVGSGAGGGTVATRLAEAGYTVLLLEAGGDPFALNDSRLTEDYTVPAFHAFASENPAMRWDFFVRHYANDERQKRDCKFTQERDGVLYPRAGTLGGCTAHNAMILIYPHNADWDDIANMTGDISWRASNMRRYFERLEDCRYRPTSTWLEKLFHLNPARHGVGGWLSTELAAPMEALSNRDLRTVLEESAVKASSQLGNRWERLRGFLKTRGDPNDWRLVKANQDGLRLVPLTTRNHVRIGSRDRILDVTKKYPTNLKIEINALVTRVLFDEKNKALGVEYLKGERLYRAHATPGVNPGERRQAFASRETILCGGAFNTPQLLMLSGIGPRQELERHGIEARIDLPGVGKNLQDRYEVSVVNRMKDDWQMMGGATFTKGDSHYREWEEKREGVYTTNGGILAVVTRSNESQLPDLFLLGMIGNFQGYFPGYSRLIAKHHNYLSWIILKAHTQNCAGTVTLRSGDPRDLPQINFRYFDEGSDRQGKDLDAVVEGIHFVRAMTKDLREQGLIAAEEVPGEQYQSDDELREFVRDNAWGHHASCSCAIGPRDKGGVLSSDFRVHGTQGLRVVDASVFPRIPGFFIVSAIYMVGEKAADVILASAKN